MDVKISFLILSCMCIVSVHSTEEYADRIPNGDRILNPCNLTQEWAGVLYLAQEGDDARNAFGIDFEAAGNQWTAELCGMDSDGDGRTNGEELGDPSCEWQPGEQPANTFLITHPGFCDPARSVWCRHRESRLVCDDAEDEGFDCPAVAGEEVMVLEATLPAMPVPSDDFTQMCVFFPVPADRNYHAIAFEPVIIREDLFHRVLLYGCDEGVQVTEPTVDDCEMIDRECNTMLALWNRGHDGYCMPDEAGIPFGSSSYKIMAVRLNWENTENLENQIDASGLRIFYTPNLRPYNENVAISGQSDITIPAMTELTTVHGTCPSGCTSVMTEAVQLTRTILFMHYLGQSGKIELYRNSTLVQVLVEYTDYQYNDVALTEFDPPITVMPGDEFKTTCSYNSKDGERLRHGTTYGGWRLAEENCYSLMFFYPGQPGFFCVQHGDRHDCLNSGAGNQCNFELIGLQFSVVFYYVSVFQLCLEDGCDDKCYEIVLPLLKDEDCFPFVEYSVRGNPQAFVEDPNLHFVMHVLDKCRDRYENPPPPATRPTCPPTGAATQHNTSAPPIVVMLLLLYMYGVVRLL